MCGITGIYNFNYNNNEKDDEHNAKVMLSTLKHRGPEQNKVVEIGNCVFAFCRLSIIDIKSGMQPHEYANGLYTMMCNGEIFNYIGIHSAI